MGARGVTNTARPGKENAGKFRKTEVECRRLSRFIRGNVDFVKMDIEGAEVDVVKELVSSGKLQHLKRMVIEYHHHNHTGEAFLGKFLSLLENAGFDYRISARIFPQMGGEYAQAVMIYANRRN
ncbi:MAG: FkbM family methyltransferase [Candidatus Micrarchaeota archaeon]